jgi:probable phosphoglycerate mutase
MKYIYFTRHGQTVWNVENKISGATDSPLTELGRNQAEELAEKLRVSDIHIDEILYSPLSRAADTALIIAAATGIPAREEKRLTEQNFGKWEGTARDGAEFRESKKHFADSYDGGESMLKLSQRIYNLLDELKAEPDDKVVLLVAHNGIARAVNSYFHDMTNEQYAAFGIKNCELVRYDF